MEARYVLEDGDPDSTEERSGQPRETPPQKFMNEQPKGMKATAILFGRGQRHYRDDEEAEDLVKVMRGCVKEEWEREFGGEGDAETNGDEVRGEKGLGGNQGEMVRRNGFGERGGKL